MILKKSLEIFRHKNLTQYVKGKYYHNFTILLLSKKGIYFHITKTLKT